MTSMLYVKMKTLAKRMREGFIEMIIQDTKGVIFIF